MMKTRSILRRLRLPLLSAVVAALAPSQALAQNVSNWTNTTPNTAETPHLWSTASNWNVPPPPAPGAASTSLFFIGGAAGTNVFTNQDNSNLYTLSQIYLAATPADLVTPTAPGIGVTANYTIGGAPIIFQTGTIVSSLDEAEFVAGSETLSGANITNSSNRGRINVTAEIRVLSPLNITIRQNNTSGGSIFLSGPIAGTSNITVAAGGGVSGEIVTITSANNLNYTGIYNQAAAGITYLAASNALFRTRITSSGSAATIISGSFPTAGYGQTDAGFNQQFGNVSGSSQISTGTNDNTATVISGYANAAASLASLGGINSGSHFGKVGTAVQTISSENASYNGQLSVRDGTFTFGATGGLLNSTAITTGLGAFTTYAGAQLRLNNATAATNVRGRLSDLTSQRLGGGTLRLDGNSVNTQVVTENLGPLVPLAGMSQIVVNSGSATVGQGGFTSFNFASFNATELNRGGQIAIIGNNLGGTPLTQGNTNVTFVAPPTAIGGVLPWGLGQATYASGFSAATPTTNPESLLELVGNSARPLTTFDGSNVNATGATALPATINSLTISAGGSVSASGPTTITSGALISRVTSTISGAGPISTIGRFYMSAATGANLTVSAPITATTLSKGGLGTVTISSAVTLAGATGSAPIVQINSGTLDLTTATVTSPNGAPIYQISRGATLAGAPTILGTLRGGGTVSGNLTIGTGGLLGASSLTSDILAPSGISTGATPGLLTVNGTLTYAGGSNGSGAASRLRFYLTSVHGGATPAIQQYTQGIIVANGLDVTAPSGQITVEPHSINLNNNVNATGAFGTTTSLYDFNPARDYSWTIVDVTGATPIVGFDANKFSVNLANFNNPGGLITPFNFTVSVENGNNLTLNYFAVPIPEPMLLGLAAAGLLVVARRRKA